MAVYQPGTGTTVDVFETETDLVVLVEWAAPTRADPVHVDRNTLTIRGDRGEVDSQAKKAYHAIEIPFGPFERIIQFPSAIDAEKATATYKNGFLEVALAKSEPIRVRKVSVETER